MTRTMYDAVTPANVPAGATMVAGYIDGIYRSYDELVRRFPAAIHVPIAVHSTTNGGIVGDRETGDMSPAQAVDWVRARRAAGVDPTVYVSLAAWPEAAAAFDRAGVERPHWWVAAYPGIGPAVYPGSVAHQYADVGGAYDVSAVVDFWPGVDGGTPPPLPTPHGRRRMQFLRDGQHGYSNSGAILMVSGGPGGLRHLNADEWAVESLYSVNPGDPPAKATDLDNPLRIVQLARLANVDDATIQNVTGIPLGA